MTESMASEPAEPTTRPDPEVRISPPAFYPQVEIAVRFPDQRHWGVVRRCNTLLYVAPGSGLDKVISEHWGLLADPAQTTELERLRAELREHQVAAANLYGRVFTALGLSIVEPWTGLADAAAVVRAERDTWEAEYERVRDLKLTDLADALAERDEQQARLDAANVIATRAIDENLPADEALRMIARTLEGKTTRALASDQPTTEEPSEADRP